MNDAVASPLTFTLDLEDSRPSDALPLRYPGATRRVLECLADLGIRASVFAVGECARREPGLLREVADAGHSIGCHSLDHTTLDRQDPDAFREATRTARSLLEDATGQPVRGYRAPVFSLTRGTRWATAILAELGFDYSSSIVPAGNPLQGWPGAPRHPFVWPEGVLELPAPVTRVGPLEMPYLGGFYLRYLPRPLIRGALARAAGEEALWTYVHPYDFDAEERYFRMKDTPTWVSLLLWFNRARTGERVEWLVRHAGGAGRFDTFERRIDAGEFADAPSWAA